MSHTVKETLFSEEGHARLDGEAPEWLWIASELGTPLYTDDLGVSHGHGPTGYATYVPLTLYPDLRYLCFVILISPLGIRPPQTLTLPALKSVSQYLVSNLKWVK